MLQSNGCHIVITASDIWYIIKLCDLMFRGIIYIAVHSTSFMCA